VPQILPQVASGNRAFFFDSACAIVVRIEACSMIPKSGTRFSGKIMRKQMATRDEADPIVPIRTSRRKRGPDGFDRNFGCHHPDFRFSGNERRVRPPSRKKALGNADGE
jgi:hypothetical protein